ncbi:bcl-2 homologous antagonist/killer-like [Babylonia areolata]|uniref:bcl-2 homologous antagonist/killer-like n=1 Tax=Babylonia areolata TaxID=304850 RepID=UPI003FD542F7
MASWDGSSHSQNDGEEKDSFLKPSPSQVMLTPRPPDEISPDSEENVKEQTEDVFRNFVYQRYRNDNIQQPYENTPVDPEITNLPRIPDSSSAEIGRQLARIGDDINEKYKDTFDTLIISMNIGSDADSAYEAFAGVARKLFSEGTNWGRIITLLCFGYRMAIRLLRSQAGKLSGFLRRIGQFLLRFLVTEKISKWIADNGGWRAALTFKPTVGTKTIAAIISLAAVTVLAVITWNRHSL